LSVVSREGNAQNVLGVANESSGGGARVQVPQTESSIPRARESELAVRRDDDILDEVGVSLEGSPWDTVFDGIGGQAPDKDGLVTRTGDDNLLVALRSANLSSGDGSDPTCVALQKSYE